MRFNDLSNYIASCAAYLLGGGDVKPILTLGQPGIGKSAASEEAATILCRRVGRDRVVNVDKVKPSEWADIDISKVVLFCAVDLSSKLPEDLGGMPKVISKTIMGQDMQVCSYAPQEWLAPFCHPDAVGILCLDDLPAAERSVATASRQLLLARRMGSQVLGKGVMMTVTGNRRQDKSNANVLPMHLVSSTQSITLDPDFESWAEWFGAQPNHAPIVASYQRFRPAMHSKLPADADENGNFPCPRTWAILGAVYDMAKESDNLLEVANGIIGEGTATDFMAFVNVRSQIIDPAKVLADPERALPDPRTSLSSPDKAHAMTTGLGEVAASWVEGGGERGKGAPLQLMRALGHCTAGSREYIATGVHTFLANGGTLAQLVAASKANKDDVHVQSVIKFLAKTFRG